MTLRPTNSEGPNFGPTFSLPDELSLLATAALSRDERGAAAVRTWLTTYDLGDTSITTLRFLPYVFDAHAGVRDDQCGPRFGALGKVKRLQWLLTQGVIRESVQALRSTGLPTTELLVLKGLAVTHHIEGTGAIRAFGDVDFWLPPAKAAMWVAPLAELGFAPSFPPGNLTRWFRRDGLYGVMPYRHSADFFNGANGRLDLHWQIVRRLHGDALSDSLVAASEVTSVAGLDARVPCREDTLVLAIINGFADQREGIRWMADIDLLWRSAPAPLSWNRVAEFAALAGQSRTVLSALEIFARFTSLDTNELPWQLLQAAALAEEQGRAPGGLPAPRRRPRSAHWPPAAQRLYDLATSPVRELRHRRRVTDIRNCLRYEEPEEK